MAKDLKQEIYEADNILQGTLEKIASQRSECYARLILHNLNRAIE